MTALIVTGLVVAGVAIVTVTVAAAVETSARVTTVVAPITVPMPVIVPARVEPEEPAAIEPPPASPRATTPVLDAACVAPPDDAGPACGWDDGFPAISPDGRRIALKHVPDDGGRGNPGLSIRVVDVATSRIVRDVTILSPDEWDAAADAPERLRATIARRVADVTRALGLARFRALAPLGRAAPWADEVDVDASAIHAEFDGAAVRIVDPARARVLWQARLSAARIAAADEDGLCAGWTLHEVDAWWDPETRAVLVVQAYTTGGCLCGVETVVHARRF